MAYLPTKSYLNCGHSQMFDPTPTLGDQLYCHSCQEYVIVVSSPQIYRVACQDCNYSRAYGSDNGRACTMAKEHAFKFTGHHVAVTMKDHTLFFYTRVRDTVIDTLTQPSEQTESSNHLGE